MKRKLLLVVLILSLAGSLFADNNAAGSKKIILDQGYYTTSDNQVYEYEKYLIEDSAEEPVLIFKNGEKTYTLDEINKIKTKAKTKKEVLSPGLKKVVNGLGAEDLVDVVIKLKNQPAYRISRNISKKYEVEISEKEEALINLHKSVLKKTDNLNQEEETNHIQNLLKEKELYSKAQRTMIKNIQEQLDKRVTEKKKEIRQAITEAVADEQLEIQSQVEILGGKIHGKIYTLNALSVRVPVNTLAKLEKNPLIAEIFYIPPVENELNVSGPAVSVANFWNDSIDGGIWDVGILDTGVQQNHPAFSGINFTSNIGTTDSNGHGTHVAGIIASNDSTYKGLAFGLDAFLVGGNSSSTVLSQADWMVGSGHQDPEVINLSSGYGIASDEDYSTFDAFFDALVDDYYLTFTKSAGNSGSGATTITHPAPAYNVITVANMEDKGTTTRSDDSIRSSSSRGPTKNNRKKPDITAPGTDIMSANSAWAGAAVDFINKTGTSMAAPHVAGSAILLTDLRGSENPISIKAIIINAADAWTDNGTLSNAADDTSVSGSLWNQTYGWGYLDLYETWFHGTDVFNSSVSLSARSKFYKGQMYANDKATLVWNRHVDYAGASEPATSDIENLTDLDLYAFNASTGSYITASATTDENVEQVAASVSQAAVLKVRCYSIDPDVGTESYALATEENFVAATAPTLTVSISAPSSVPYNGTATVTATCTNSGDLSAFNTYFNLTLSGFTLVSGSTSQNKGTLTNNGGQASVTWIVRKSTTGTGSITVKTSSSSYYDSFTGSRTVTIN